MHRRRDNLPSGSLGVQALYTIPALARVANVTRYLLRRLLLASGVPLLRSGRVLYVPLSEIEKRIPPLWESICAGEKLRRQAEDKVGKRESMAHLGASRAGKPQE
jgi:hypothetical protein